MAKATKVGGSNLQVDDEDLGDPVVETMKAEQEAMEQIADPAVVAKFEARLNMLDQTIFEVAESVSELRELCISLNARLDQEKEARINASTDTLANMDQTELAQMILNIVLSKYLDNEANSFHALAENPTIVQTSMRDLLYVYRQMVSGLQKAIRHS